ncbi:MAG: MaoC family dehydratase N-terminal domain-containing protein [Proteobacteria bacterium]|nr:MaoC family dehydratase N-terminal domain-containing protein [Pseudomonadota bacterium]
MSDATDLVTRARAFVGKPAATPVAARDPVNLPAIRRWCDAMGDRNPVYQDAAAARAAGFDGIVAPPAMLDVWTMSPFRPGGRASTERMQVLELFDAAGFTGVVATNVEQDYDRYLHEGDRVHCTAIVEDVSEEKRTALGVGHFVTLRYEFTDDAGDAVGRMLFRVLKFRPPLAQAATAQAAAVPKSIPHPRPAVTHDNAFFWEGIKARRLLVQCCAACGRLRHPPGPMCPQCRSLEWRTVEASGRGTIHSFVVMHQPRLPALHYPLTILLVELAEGVRVVANLLEAGAQQLQIGRAVALDFVEVEPGYLLPAFRLA